MKFLLLLLLFLQKQTIQQSVFILLFRHVVPLVSILNRFREQRQRHGSQDCCPHRHFRSCFVVEESHALAQTFNGRKIQEDLLSGRFIKFNEGCVSAKVEVFLEDVAHIVLDFESGQSFPDQYSLPYFFSVFFRHSILDGFHHVGSRTHHTLEGIAELVDQHVEDELTFL